MNAVPRDSVFSLASMMGGPAAPVWGPPVEFALGLGALQRMYLSMSQCAAPGDFIAELLARLGVSLEVAAQDLAKIPCKGPLVVVANHPFGGIEGLALARLLLDLRPDVRVMVNFLLGRIPELRDLFLLVDPFDGPGAEQRSVAGLRVARKWLNGGGALVVFPAGEVAHFHLRRFAVVDPPWLSAVARLVRRSKCPVLPVHFEGRNRTMFQIAGLVHRHLRTALLPREFLACRGKTLRVRVGSTITPSDIAAFDNDDAVMAYLRRRTEILGERPMLPSVAVQPRRTPSEHEEIHPEVSPEVLATEIAALPPEAKLASGGGQEVWISESDHIPKVLTEIGRLRELTFREVGEGTGRRLDLDRFDATYRHLFIWHPGKREIVGAYRIGMTDDLLKAQGRKGLYTSTLFKFKKKLFKRMGPALEMGRSFIRPEYQRSFAGLLLLWKGIGRFVAQHPEQATLFGPVSISAEYVGASQQLIVAFLKRNSYRHKWSKWVRARNAFKNRPSKVIQQGVAFLRDLDEVSRYISELESDSKGAPVLLRQYLKLGGKMLGFNVDPDFSDVLDVLVMVDLRKTPKKTLVRYMGSDGAAEFLRFHGIE